MAQIQIKDMLHIIFISSLALFLSLCPVVGLSEGEEEGLTEDKEKNKKDKIENIENFTQEFLSKKGFFKVYQDPKTSALYLSIKEDQLNHEFIYFAHVIDGVVAARKPRGSYLDNGILRLEKHFETLRLIRVNTAFSFNKNSELSRSEGANISNSVVQVFPIKFRNDEENEYLIEVSSLFLSVFNSQARRRRRQTVFFSQKIKFRKMKMMK